jgi:hypothetical protein
MNKAAVGHGDGQFDKECQRGGKGSQQSGEGKALCQCTLVHEKSFRSESLSTSNKQ